MLHTNNRHFEVVYFFSYKESYAIRYYITSTYPLRLLKKTEWRKWSEYFFPKAITIVHSFDLKIGADIAQSYSWALDNKSLTDVSTNGFFLANCTIVVPLKLRGRTKWTSKTPFGAMNEREQACGVKVCAVTSALVQISSIPTHSKWFRSHTPSFSAILPAVPQIRNRCAHVQLCPIPNFCKSLANMSLTYLPYLSAIRHVVPGIRKGGHICACTREDV